MSAKIPQKTDSSLAFGFFAKSELHFWWFSPLVVKQLFTSAKLTKRRSITSPSAPLPGVVGLDVGRGRKESIFSSQVVGFQPLNHKKQRCKMLPKHEAVEGCWQLLFAGVFPPKMNGSRGRAPGPGPGRLVTRAGTPIHFLHVLHPRSCEQTHPGGKRHTHQFCAMQERSRILATQGGAGAWKRCPQCQATKRHSAAIGS